ncbi:winged helix-turn-helix domain-containing protein (plasmid) [Paraburkholderia sp. PREW-6R]|uniref:winged helix-turn-helix domain-containing protein n=1 Tax=Paraburkholderia sp. PREW-6R TaxID=3141544 RepID=UPI0031F5084B
MNSIGIQRFVLNGRWVFDETVNQVTSLTGATPSIALPAVVTRLLGVLVRSPNEIFSRRRLFDEVWRRHGLEVGDNSLNQVIHGLRTSFERLGEGAPIVKTVPRVGYCLIANVTIGDAATNERKPLHSVEQPSAPALQPAWSASPPRILLDAQTFRKCTELEWRRALRSGLPMSLLMLSPDVHTGMTADPIAVTEVIETTIVHRLRRPGDQGARYSATEHAVLLPDTDRQGAAHVAQEIQRAIQTGEYWQGFGPPPRVLVAVGQACTAQRRYATVDDWIETARMALLEVLGTPLNRAIPRFKGD